MHIKDNAEDIREAYYTTKYPDALVRASDVKDEEVVEDEVEVEEEVEDEVEVEEEDLEES